MKMLHRLAVLREQQRFMNLFAVVDGFQFEQLHGKQLERCPGCEALFDGTPDAPLAAAGPWLVEAQTQASLAATLAAQEADAPHVSWIFTPVPLSGLAQLLRLRLDARLPDGSTALLRFYDPRVLYGLATTLRPAQREQFFSHIHEWHFTYEGRSMKIARDDA